MTQKKQEPSAYADASFMDDPKLKDEGKKWIRHYGCAGCHEISGFEDEGRIGTELTYEGSKPIERLDFALFTEVAQRGGKGRADHRSRRSGAPARRPGQRALVRPQGILRAQAGRAQRLRQGQGQVAKTEALRMPNLHLTKEQMQALTTFLLGSQESSPARQLPVQAAATARRDIQEGWWVVRKYNCMGCHQFIARPEARS